MLMAHTICQERWWSSVELILNTPNRNCDGGLYSSFGVAGWPATPFTDGAGGDRPAVLWRAAFFARPWTAYCKLFCISTLPGINHGVLDNFKLLRSMIFPFINPDEKPSILFGDFPAMFDGYQRVLFIKSAIKIFLWVKSNNKPSPSP